MLTEQQRHDFFQRGYLQLSGAVDASDVEIMRNRVWAELESHGYLKDDKSTWPEGHAAQLKDVRKDDPNPMDNELLVSAISELLNREWKLRPDWGQVLVTFPFNVPWRVPGSNWHLDHPFKQPDEYLTGVNVFLLLSELKAHGGGTSVLEGSPVLVSRFTERHPELETATWSAWKNVFRNSDPYLKRLTNKNETSSTPSRNAFFMEQETVVDEVPVRVAEITGAAGDVFICHPLLMHAVPIGNVQDQPRMMRTLRVGHGPTTSSTAKPI